MDSIHHALQELNHRYVRETSYKTRQTIKIVDPTETGQDTDEETVPQKPRRKGRNLKWEFDPLPVEASLSP